MDAGADRAADPGVPGLLAVAAGRRRSAVVFLAVLAALGGASARPALSASRAPDGPVADSALSRCMPGDTVADALLDSLRAMATLSTHDPASQRAKLQLPTLASALEVQQITKGGGCATAARVADSVWSRAGSSRHDSQRRVYLFGFGDLFVVIAASRDNAGHRTISSFTGSWKYLATISF